MLTSPEYDAIKSDYDQTSRAHFERGYFHPDGMKLVKFSPLSRGKGRGSNPPLNNSTARGCLLIRDGQLHEGNIDAPGQHPPSSSVQL